MVGQHADLVGVVPTVLEVVAKPSRPVVLHVEQVRLVHGVDRQRRRHTAALHLPVAAHVGEGATTRCPARLVVEVVVVRDLRGVLAVREAGALQMIDLAIEFLLASLQLLQLLQAFP